MALREIELYVYQVPFRQPLRSRHTVLTHREGLLVAVTSVNGQKGWGEAAPLPGFSEESLEEAITVAQRLALSLKGANLEEARRIAGVVNGNLSSVHFAFKSALDSLAALEAGLPLYQYLGAVSLESVSVCALLAGDEAFKRARAREAIRDGARVMKLKVGGGDLEQDIALVREIAGWLPPEGRLRLDANRSWEREEALRFCSAIPAEKIAFLEEPTRDFLDMPTIQKASGIACAADETLQLLSRQCCRGASCHQEPAADALREVAAQVDVLVWKPSLCLPLPLLGVKQDRPVVLSGAYETGVGTAAILALAAACGGVYPAVGVDTYSRLAADVLVDPLHVTVPEIPLGPVEDARRSVSVQNLKRVFHV